MDVVGNEKPRGTRKIYSFTDLYAWQEGHMLVQEIYRMIRQFPIEERFGLASQMSRASVSITSNIAEGFSRSSYREKAQFYAIALGSLTETQNQILVARDVGYIKADTALVLLRKSEVVNKLINGLIKKSKSLAHDS